MPGSFGQDFSDVKVAPGIFDPSKGASMEHQSYSRPLNPGLQNLTGGPSISNYSETNPYAPLNVRPGLQNHVIQSGYPHQTYSQPPHPPHIQPVLQNGGNIPPTFNYSDQRHSEPLKPGLYQPQKHQ
jgi:hypothetical protein